MITLWLPFRGQNMEKIFNKVCKGKFGRNPEKFSDVLYQVLRFLFKLILIQGRVVNKF